MSNQVVELLTISAIPRWVTLPLLAYLVNDKTTASALYAQLLHQPDVRLEREPIERGRLAEEVRDQVLRTLQQQDATRYANLNERAFCYFADRLSAPNIADRTLYEDECIYHLGQLFNLYISSHELQPLTELLTQAKQLILQQEVHRHAWSYYQAVVEMERGDYLVSRERLLQVVAQTPPTAHPLYARAWNSLGTLYSYLDHFDKAADAYRKSQQIYQLLNDEVGSAKVANNLGIIYRRLGEYQAAEQSFLIRLATAQKYQDQFGQAVALNQLGAVAKDMGQWTQAENYYSTSLLHWKALEVAVRIGQLHNNLGELYQLIGNFSAAEQHYTKALAIFADRDNAIPLERIDVLHNLGFLFFTQKFDKEAEAHFAEALQAAEMSSLPFAISQLYFRLGNLWQRQGDQARALTAYTHAIATVEEMLLNEEQEKTKIGLMGARQHIYQAIVLLYCKLAQLASALTYVEKARSRAFLDMLPQPALYPATRQEAVLTLAQIQAKLPEDTVIVEYFTTGHAGLWEEMLRNLPAETQFLRNDLLPERAMFVFAITRQAIVGQQLPSTVQQIEARYFHNLGHKRFRGTTPQIGERLSALHRWHMLYQELLAPLQSQLTDKKRLILIPHSTLHYLPLHALAPANDLFHQQKLTISYAPSASALMRTGFGQQARIGRPKTYLTIGVNREDLLHAETEAIHIGEQLSGLQGKSKTKLIGETLLGSQATVADVMTALPNAHIIHFACHGNFRRATPMNSALVLHDDELSAATILQLSLTADLVILSACDTGLNELAHGDELMGMTRAFLGAGASAVMVTLWPVVDLPTRLFMEAFYAAWIGEQQTAAEALTTAQQILRTMTADSLYKHLLMIQGVPAAKVEQDLSILKAMLPDTEYIFDHPYYWGAFILVGNPG